MLRTKKSLLRQTAFSCCLSALLGGISEPTIYGICYKMVRPYYAYLITALSTAVLAGLLHLKCYARGYSSTNILLYLGPNLDYANFRNALLLVGFMLIMSFITVNLIGSMIPATRKLPLPHRMPRNKFTASRFSERTMLHAFIR